MSILDHWPIESAPRSVQVEALEWLESQTAKYLFLEAPVGSGKSLIGLTYSSFLRGRTNKGSSYIYTPQKILQRQYEREKENINYRNYIGSFYGRSNYVCEEKNTNCEIGSIVGKPCSCCAYKTAKSVAKMCSNTVFNYKLGLLSFAHTTSFDPRELIILDECHNAEKELTEFDAIVFSVKTSTKFSLPWKHFVDTTKAYYWVKNSYAPTMIKNFGLWYEAHRELLEDSEHVNLTKSEEQVLRDYRKFKRHVEDVNYIISLDVNVVTKQFVLVSDTNSMKFKRLKAGHSFNNILEPMARRFLFMSSTILDYQGFCDDMGIDSKDAAFLSVESEFPLKSRPVFYTPQLKMNKDWRDNTAGQARMQQQVVKLLSEYGQRKGIIHTGNFQIAGWIVEHLEQSDIEHQIFHHNPGSDVIRDHIIDDFQECTTPAVLISPSITEGLDLKDDLGRFAIFMKVPFPFIGDAWIRARMQMSTSWYHRQALTAIIQGGGRIVRSKNDWGDTFILDGSWGYLSYKASHMFPKWWGDSLERL